MERYIEYFGMSAAIWLSVLILMVIGMIIPKLFKYMDEYSKKCRASECIIWPGVLAGFLMGFIVVCLFGITLAITSLIQYYTVPENIIIEHFKFLLET